MNDEWVSNQVVLKYSLSDLVLFRIRLQMKVLPLQTISEDSVSAASELSPPNMSLVDGEKGFLFRSLPLQSKQPLVRAGNGWIYYTPDQFDRYYINLDQTFDEYTSKFSSKTRSTIKRKIKKFAKHCGEDGMKWQSYKTPEEMKEFYKFAREVSKKSYQERLLDAGLPETDEFVNEMSSKAEQGDARGYLLFDKEVPVAYIYCPISDGVLLYQYLGFDPQYNKMSVGTILHWLVFQDIFEEGKFKYFDFTEGQSDHKKQFSTDSLFCGNVYMFPRKPGGMAIVYSHHLIRVLSKKAGELVESMGLKTKIRQLLRS